ncbi:MAG: hypothetical protein QOH39_1320 [Verrucomicrobiota bacterium]|jgi:hypothetical protein
MKWFVQLLGMVVALGSISAGTQGEEANENTTDSSFKPIFSLTGEYVAEATYIGDADVERGRTIVRDFSESDIILRFVLTPRIKIGVLRIGMEWERFDFGMPNNAPLPDTLQSASLIVGLDTQFSDSILVRLEAQPGFYGTNHLSFDEVNMPFIVGGTYIYNPNLQFIVGVSVDIERKYPVLPAAGVRWKIARQWVVNAVLPEPRIEFEGTKSLTLYLGANVKETNFRVDEHFGDSHGNPVLNHAVLTYSEVRTGLGADWKITPNVILTAEAGYQPYRNFDFYRANIRFHEDGSAPYGMLSLHGAF